MLWPRDSPSLEKENCPPPLALRRVSSNMFACVLPFSTPKHDVAMIKRSTTRRVLPSLFLPPRSSVHATVIIFTRRSSFLCGSRHLRRKDEDEEKDRALTASKNTTRRTVDLSFVLLPSFFLSFFFFFMVQRLVKIR